MINLYLNKVIYDLKQMIYYKNIIKNIKNYNK